MLVYTPEVSVCLHELYQCLQELNCSSSMTSSMTSSTEADLTQVIPILVDGIAQEIGAERRDMKVTFVADHLQHDLSSWRLLKYEIMAETSFVWQRPNDLSHPRAYFEISFANDNVLMNPINTTNECVPKDIKGSGAYTELLRHAMRANLSVRPKCSHRCVSLKESPFKPLQILRHTTRTSTEQPAMRTKCFKHIVIQTVQEHLLFVPAPKPIGTCLLLSVTYLSQAFSLFLRIIFL